MIFAVENSALLGPGGISFLCLYLFGLLFIGWMGHRAKKETSLSDFYLGGRGFGFIVLLLTLYATQYSGNTLLGFVGNAYRQGFLFLVSITFMMAIIGVYLIYAPRLQRLASKRHYITMGDYLQDRYRYRPLTLLATFLGVIALGNYILTNLKALGLLAERISGIEGSYIPGVILLAVIMLIYETLGGLRSVAWTDVLQGIILLIGVISIYIAIQIYYGGIAGMSGQLQETKPEFYVSPTLEQKISWLSTLFLIGIGIAFYPHAIQRIFAAKSATTLRRSLQVMVFFPLITTLFMVTLGIMGTVQFPDLGAESDEVTLLWLGELIEQIPGLQWLLILCICAIVAATMSTVDSSLLAISCLMARDVYHPLKPHWDQRRLNLCGKATSITVMILAIILAIVWKESKTIWQLIELKLELLCQVAPAFLIGIHWMKLRSGPVFLGMLVGTTIAIYLRFLPIEALSNVHAGIWGLLVNLALAVGLSLWQNRRSPRLSEPLATPHSAPNGGRDKTERQ